VLTQLVAFTGVSIVVICTPGPDTALTIRNTLVGGRRRGVLTALGVTAGLATWSVAASAGLAAVVRASEPAFLALRLAGAAYLLFLGAQALRAAIAGRGSEALEPGPSVRMSSSSAFRQGLISNLSNPKIAVFFTSLLPQFAPSGRASFLALLLLGLLFCLLTLAWLAAYAYAVARARRVLAKPGVRRALDGLTGGVLIVFGLRLASEHR
jgi:threonine/homoserine/homoserine lactone efflux protein